MKGSDLKAFRKANNLTQPQLGEYLGIGKSFISTIESGKDPMPKDKLSKLLNNPFNWDTSMLVSEDGDMAVMGGVIQVPYDEKYENIMAAIRSMRNKFESSGHQGNDDPHISYLEKKIEDKDALIRELYKEIGVLQAKLDLITKGDAGGIVVSTFPEDKV